MKRNIYISFTIFLLFIVATSARFLGDYVCICKEHDHAVEHICHDSDKLMSKCVNHDFTIRCGSCLCSQEFIDETLLLSNIVSFSSQKESAPKIVALLAEYLLVDEVGFKLLGVGYLPPQSYISQCSITLRLLRAPPVLV